MNQEEVNLIYDYLHENYRYEDGDLIRLKSSFGWNAGHKIGTFSHHEKVSKAQVKAIIKINKTPIMTTLAHLIWIFYYNKKPVFIDFKDNNPMNTKIENLSELSSEQMYAKNRENCKGTTKIINKDGVKWRALIVCMNKSIFLGHYKTESEALEIYKLARKAINKGIYDAIDIKKYINDHSIFGCAPIQKNSTGFKGVKKTKHGTYYGRLRTKELNFNTPCFKTPEEAHEACLKAKKELTNQ